jgi:hypothetical protein
LLAWSTPSRSLSIELMLKKALPLILVSLVQPAESAFGAAGVAATFAAVAL